MMHSYSVMVSTSVEGDTNQASNLGGTKIILSLVATQKKEWQGASLWHLWLVWALLPRVVEVVANLVGHDWPMLRCGPIG